MALRPILEVCDIDTGFEGGERHREPWRRQTTARKQLSATLKDISAATRERSWKPRRHAKAEETWAKMSQKIGQGAISIGMLGRRQVTTRWANCPVWLHTVSRQEIGQGRMRANP